VTDHVHGEGSYIECDRYNVVSVSYYKDRHSDLPPDLSIRRDCYCGNEATHVARVGFHTVVEERDDWWDRTHSRTFKAHRCDEHSFEETQS
jgi:hypothetical protein